MSFSFQFTIDEEGNICQDEFQAQSLKGQVKSGIVPTGETISVGGHRPTGPGDWGNSLNLQIPSLGNAMMSSVFPKAPTVTAEV